jgi:hypothetical protein
MLSVADFCVGSKEKAGFRDMVLGALMRRRTMATSRLSGHQGSGCCGFGVEGFGDFWLLRWFFRLFRGVSGF